jgi:hypothetical protein
MWSSRYPEKTYYRLHSKKSFSRFTERSQHVDIKSPASSTRPSLGFLPIDRWGALNSLKVELEVLEDDLASVETLREALPLQMAGLYVLACKCPHRELQIGKRVWKIWMGILKEFKDKVKESKTEVMYERMKG